MDLSLVLAVQVFRCWAYYLICARSSLGKIFLDLGLFLIWSRKGHATKGHLIVYNLLYLPPIKGKTVLYLKIISHKGTIFQGLVIQIQDSFITYIVWSFVCARSSLGKIFYYWFSVLLD